MSEKTVYRITFHYQDSIYEVYCTKVSESSLFGFIEIEDIVFGETSSVLLDPSEEKLRNEFKGVKRTYIPLGEVYRIDEVEQRGKAKIMDASSNAKSNVSTFPRSFKMPDPGRND